MDHLAIMFLPENVLKWFCPTSVLSKIFSDPSSQTQSSRVRHCIVSMQGPCHVVADWLGTPPPWRRLPPRSPPASEAPPSTPAPTPRMVPFVCSILLRFEFPAPPPPHSAAASCAARTLVPPQFALTGLGAGRQPVQAHHADACDIYIDG